MCGMEKKLKLLTYGCQIGRNGYRHAVELRNETQSCQRLKDVCKHSASRDDFYQRTLNSTASIPQSLNVVQCAAWIRNLKF